MAPAVDLGRSSAPSQGPVSQREENGGERTEPPGEADRVARGVARLECSAFSKNERRGGTSCLDGKFPRRRFRLPQQPEHEAPDGSGAAGGSLRKRSHGEQQSGDAPKRLVMFPDCPLHARVHVRKRALLHGSERKARKIFLEYRVNDTIPATNAADLPTPGHSRCAPPDSPASGRTRRTGCTWNRPVS